MKLIFLRVREEGEWAGSWVAEANLLEKRTKENMK